MKKWIALCAALVLLLSACTPVPQATGAPWAKEPDPRWLEDYDYFWRIVEENYALWAAAGRITGRDLLAVKEHYRAVAASAADISTLYTALSGCADAFQKTGHFALLGKSDYEYRMNLFWEMREQDPKLAFQLRRMATQPAMDYYDYALTPEQERYLAQPLGYEGPEREQPRNLSVRDYPERSTAYVSVRGMLVDVEADGAFLAEFFQETASKGYENCIIDIRGNLGGSDSYWRSCLVGPNISEPLIAQNYALIKGEDALAHHAAFQNLRVSPIEELPVEELPALLSEDLEGITHFARYGMSARPRADGPLFTGRFWLLVDGGVYSAAESFASFCKQTGFATLVGAQTGGDGVGMEPLCTALPNSGICFQFSDVNGLNADGSCNEEYGTAPDIPIGPGEDALEVCLAAIAGLTNQ